MVTLTAPYISGFLAFRETPYLLEALQRLETTQPSLLPQVRFGLACHLGVLSGLPCIGVAKNLLQVQGVEKNEKHQSQIASLQKGGESFPLTSDSGKVLGKVRLTRTFTASHTNALRSSDSSTKPVYVSVGHKISLDTALRLTHSCCRYRVPEPIRQHRASSDRLPSFLVLWKQQYAPAPQRLIAVCCWDANTGTGGGGLPNKGTGIVYAFRKRDKLERVR
uniref:Endonuclease V n=1 Tax=Oncorhynchus mykiss TaxID=8022 RepID=A0A8C7PDP5_ONCMY